VTAAANQGQQTAKKHNVEEKEVVEEKKKDSIPKKKDGTGPQTSTTNAKKTSQTQNKHWVPFTGQEKKDPIYTNWLLVRQVLCADTFRLAEIKVNPSLTPPKIITFSLEGIRCPQVARNSEETDMACGYEAREFVRKHLCDGNPVVCAAWNVNLGKKKTPHYYGDIYFQSPTNNPKKQKIE